MEPPRLREEQAAVRGDHRVLAQDVLQGRPLGAVRVRPLRDLRELVGIAQQDERPHSLGRWARLACQNART
jgi:hypothetical protein